MRAFSKYMTKHRLSITSS